MALFNPNLTKQDSIFDIIIFFVHLTIICFIGLCIFQYPDALEYVIGYGLASIFMYASYSNLVNNHGIESDYTNFTSIFNILLTYLNNIFQFVLNYIYQITVFCVGSLMWVSALSVIGKEHDKSQIIRKHLDKIRNINKDISAEEEPDPNVILYFKNDQDVENDINADIYKYGFWASPLGSGASVIPLIILRINYLWGYLKEKVIDYPIILQKIVSISLFMQGRAVAICIHSIWIVTTMIVIFIFAAKYKSYNAKVSETPESHNEYLKNAIKWMDYQMLIIFFYIIISLLLIVYHFALCI